MNGIIMDQAKVSSDGSMKTDEITHHKSPDPPESVVKNEDNPNTIISSSLSLPQSELVISPPPENKQSGDTTKSSDKTKADQNENPYQGTGVGQDGKTNGGAKRVRFSICEYITETLVQENGVNGFHDNPSFENDDEAMGNGKSKEPEGGGSKVRYIGGKLRRDSVHPLVPFHAAQLGVQQTNSWDVDTPIEEEEDAGTPWSELSRRQKAILVLIGIGKFLGLLALLYFFVCSLDLLSLGFRLVGGRTAGEIFRKSSILQNPIVGLMIGILTTVLVQSSSTSTSIIVGMVAAGFMDVRLAIPPIMGANIGTSITNTIVSFTQAGDRDQFRRAFAGATILDMFNWITVMVLLPIEVLFGYLYHVSKASVDLIIPDSQSGGEVQILSVITRPFVDLIVQLNDTVLECWATPNCTDADEASLIKEYCSTIKTEIFVQERVVDLSGKELLNIRDVARQEDWRRCDFLFAGTSMSDAAVGAIVLVSSLFVLCFCLVMIVKLLSSVLQGHVSTVIKHTLNADIPYVPWITGYIAIFIGAVMTFLVQSSSVFTSALTPLVGLGVISLNRVYPLTLGANIGTTTTALLASMAADGKQLYPSLQIALCHFFFNITGVLLFYPIPFLRFPIRMAKVLGNTTAKYRWFAIFYLVSMFAVVPVVFITLSLAGSIYVIVLVSIIAVIIFLVFLLTLMQRKAPHILPEKLRDWKWMPKPLRSLKPYDNLISRMPCCSNKNSKDDEDNSSDDDDDDGGFSGRSSIYKNNDFIFLSGNKIPPPNGYNKDDIECQRSSIPKAPAIMRIVPTRVIRNISSINGSNGDYHSVTEKGGDRKPASGTINGSTQSNRPTDLKITPKNNEELNNKGEETGAGTGTVPGNTVPLPEPINEESESPNVSLEDAKNNRNIKSLYTPSRRELKPSLNLAFNESAESFRV